jgi:transcriptional regulator with XRE-family HTH domain
MTPTEFRSAREALGWDRAALARRLGYASENSIRQIETGRQSVRPEHAEWLKAASLYLREHPTPRE